jgi:hypothetical protein
MKMTITASSELDASVLFASTSAFGLGACSVYASTKIRQAIGLAIGLEIWIQRLKQEIHKNNEVIDKSLSQSSKASDAGGPL